MARIQKAVREAQRVLEATNVSRMPVDVERLASKWAHVVKQRLDDDISGMLVPLPKPVQGRHWAIVVNHSHSDVRQRFTIAHELGHLLLHGYTSAHADRSFKIRLRDSQSSEGSIREEIEANRFAAELLMPAEVIRRRLLNHVFEYVPEEQPSERELDKLAREFNVSKQALQIRLSSLFA
jgi:hypothetical protein